MRTVSLIQIGDVHYPEAKSEVVGDIKDAALSPAVADQIAPKKLAKVFQHIGRTRQALPLCGILICGDLTTKGNLDAYRECVDYLRSTLQLDVAGQDELWHAVPGNHDVARKTLVPGESPFPTLFSPLAETWKTAIGRDPLSIDALRATSIATASSCLALYSLNSCLGCGEWRRIPDSIRSSLALNIKTVVDSETDSDKKFALLSEQLDAPFFHDAHITALCAAIEVLDRCAVPVILAHHNLLPQATPRLDIYTELLNGGVVRTRLAHLARPVIYCHGHIHEDPVELISSPETPGGLVVAISAPEATRGYNLLTFFFSRDGSPLGMEVARFRLATDGDIRKAAPLRVSFCETAKSISSLSAEICDAVRACNPVPGPLAGVRDQLEPKPNYDTLGDRLREAEWYGLVRIQNRDATSSRELRVERVVP